MSPIRTALIGLSASPTGTSWATSAHLPYLLSSSHYEIVALLNSSKQNAESARVKFGLGEGVRTYGDPEDLANDKDVDLVVCSVRVDRHLQTVRPSIIAGKTVFVEWPLERNLAIAKEMAALAKAHNAKTIIGLQGSFDPTIRKMREFVQTGKLGRVVSSSIVASLGNGGVSEKTTVRYFLERGVGGNVVSIHGGHTLEVVGAVLGGFESYKSVMAIRHEKKDILDGDEIVERDVKNEVPDQILIQGIAGPDKAPISIHLRGGPPLPGTPGIEWRIQGSLGELRLESPSWALSVGREDTKVVFYDGKGGSEVWDARDEGEFGGLPQPARNIGRIYEAFARGEWVPDWEWAVKRHEVVEGLWRGFDGVEG
ncbi:NAD(P)-binding Rossmann-fold containing protein [Glarea lozoyensis ATCC 20868]|uniref:NAD(P)-binding Rossmann-fold containing protein n=1 Tax=Glarea lozoyensis (strain ATCC 20868 / MF5171) TaxID=1116229 RepID=S3CJF4_GLAL2|nr:NAD(P)-binding Rossmann-fold containing protein [Glarea lozoyensis ATCC 20868]EPE25344.1 NAD(P)-binding Rossmann-fold containing protein [Glarea lozoyensis ATCC 20868]